MTYSAVVLVDAPTLYYRLGDASGTTMTDSSGNGFNGTYRNAPTLGAAGLLTGDADTSVTFGGSPQRANVKSHTVGGGSSFTFECWVKGASIPTSAHLLDDCRISSGTPFVRLFVDVSGHVNFTGRNDSGGATFSVVGTTNVKDGNAHHVVGTKSGTTFTLYIDGASEGTPATATFGTVTLDQTVIGASALGTDSDTTAGNYLIGTLDEVATYSTALSGTRVLAHYNEGISPTAPTAKTLSATHTQTASFSTVTTLVTAKTLSATQTQTASFTATGPTITAKTLSATHTQTSSFTSLAGIVTVPTGSETTPTYLLKVVNMTGGSAVTLTNAEPVEIVKTLNAPDEFTIMFPKNAYAAADIPVIGTPSSAREVQIYRNSDLWAWGPIIGIAGAGNDGAMQAHGAGVDWYLNRSFVDGTIPNLVTNGDFESGSSSWTANGGVSLTIDSGNYVTGTQSMEIDNLIAGGDTQIHQNGIAVGPNGVGVLVTASAWFYIDTFTSGAFGNLGLFIEGLKNGVVQANDYYAIDAQTPRGVWTKTSVGENSYVVTLQVPPNETWTINVRLYGPQGTIHWDDVHLVAMDSVSTAGLTGSTTKVIDIANILQLLVSHAQSTSAGKSNLNIGTHCEPTGVKLTKTWQYVDHVQFDQALREFLDRDDGADYCIDYTPTTRTFHSFANKRGTDRSGTVTLRYDVANPATSNCIDYRYTADGTALVTRQIIIGDDNGPDRDQGETADATQVGGVILQDVRQAPQGTAVGSLEPLADERLARYKTVPLTFEMDLVGSSGLIPTLKPGDLVTASVADGYVAASGVYRIMSLRLTCATNILTVTLARDTL